MLKHSFLRTEKALSGVIAIILLSCLLSYSAIAASVQISTGQNILLGANTFQVSIGAGNPLNGTLSVIASANLAPQSSEINLSQSDFTYSGGAYSCTKAISLNALSAGQYFITAILYNSSEQIAADSKSGNIVASLDITPPQITDYGPSGILNTTSIRIYAVTNENATCRGSFESGDMSYEQMGILMSGSGNLHWHNTTLPEDDYSFYIKCRDAAGNTMPSFQRVSFANDITPPQITDYSPKSPIGSDYTTLFASTNEPSICSYNSTGSAKIQMSTSDGMNHVSSLDGLSAGVHYYTITCADVYGNRMNAGYTIQVDVNTPVSAEITMSAESPIKAGLYEITVKTSRGVKPTPSLSYKIGEITSTVELAGSGSAWKGFMIIPADKGNQVGAFYFKGTDYSGEEGSAITSGKVFIVDTIKPAQPVISAFSNQDGGIRLSIRYDGEETGSFRIYRSTASGVTIMDLYAETNETAYVDENVSNSVTYYYAVSAVDMAGNEGDMSSEAYAISTRSSGGASELSPSTLKKIDEAMALASSAIDTVNERESAISKILNGKEALEASGVISSAEDAKIRLDNIYASLNSMKDGSADESALKSELSSIELSIRSIEKSVPLDVKITEYSGSSLQASGEDIAAAVGQASPENAADVKYINSATALQGAISQKISGALVSIVYESSTDYLTFVEQEITGKSSVKDATIVITIPKSVAEDTSKIDFLTEGYSIIENDPVISMPYSGEPGTVLQIKYVIKGKATESDLTGVKAVLLKTESADASPATGNAVIESIKANAKYIGIILGMLVLGVLAAYYFRIGKRPDEGGRDEIEEIIGEEAGLLGEREKTGKTKEADKESACPEEDYPKEKISREEQNLTGEKERNSKSIDEIISGLKAIPLDGLSPLQKKIVASKIRRLEEIKGSEYSESEKQVTEGRAPIRTEEIPAETTEKSGNTEKASASETEPLQLYNGKIVRSLDELRSALSRMDSDTFNYHVNYEKNDFASWIKKSLRDRKLYAEMKKAKSREEAFSIIKRARPGK